MGSSFGFGASTNHYKDFKNARVILVEGNNPAENHPMGMKWILRAKEEHGARLIVVDPRFTRTAAHADEYVAIRPGTDIAFQGALIRHVLEGGHHDRAFLEQQTNARYRVHPDFSFADGYFSGLRTTGGDRSYDPATWTYALGADGEPEVAGSLEEEGTVFDHLRRHFSRYTPEVAAEITGVPAEQIERVAEAFVAARPGVVMYALGATQHTVGVQQIRCYAILQLLLGNMGVPGGGVGANRGESNVQGATDMAVLWDKLPGYLPQPGEWERSFAEYRRAHGTEAAAGLANLLRAWFDRELSLEDAYRLLPRVPRGVSYSLYDLLDRMRAGEVEGLVVLGQNPVVSQPDRRLTMRSLAALRTLVVVDIFETETAAFWNLEGDPRAVDTEVWLLPAAGFLEKPGSLTNSGRWVQGRETVVDPPGEARPDLWILDQLFRRLRARAEERARPRDQALRVARWDYGEAEYERVLREIAGEAVGEVEGEEPARLEPGEALPGSAWLRDDGSTSCGNRLYAGLFAGGENLSLRREVREDDPDARHEGWAWSWPDNTRILYDKESARPFFKTGEGVARLFAAEYARIEDGEIVRRSLRPVDGPFPEHYEPYEGPFANPLHPDVARAPLVRWPRTPEHRELGDPGEFPYVLTTGFLHEMWGGGAMSRRLGPLVEAQPEPFVEISKTLAADLGVTNGERVRLSTARGAIELEAMVTERIRPVMCAEGFVEIVWAPMHWGDLGDSTGASVNTLTLDVLEPNVSIQETKACRCRIDPVRRGAGGEHP